MRERSLEVNDPNDRLRRALAAQRLSPLEAARSGGAEIGDLAQVLGRQRTQAAPTGRVSPRTRGCEICRAAVVVEGLCEQCRKRMVLPLVDAEAAKEAATGYRVQREARRAVEREEMKRSSHRQRAGIDQTVSAEGLEQEDHAPPFRPERSADGRLFLQRCDGSGYTVGTGVKGFVAIQAVLANGTPGGRESHMFVEDFVRAYPEVAASPGCVDAVRLVGYAEGN